MFRIRYRPIIYNPKNLYYIKRNFNNVIDLRKINKESPIHSFNDNKEIYLNQIDRESYIYNYIKEDQIFKKILLKNLNNLDQNIEDIRYYNQNFEFKGRNDWMFEW